MQVKEEKLEKEESLKEEKQNSRKKKNFSRLVPLINFALIIIIFLFLLISFWYNPLVIKNREQIVELNHKYSKYSNIDYMVFGDKKDVKFSGKVDISKIGVYHCKYTVRGVETKFDVRVEDKEAPNLVTKSYETNLKEDISVSDFIKSLKDNDKSKVEAKFKKDYNKEKKEGEEIVTIIAIDKSGNKVEKEAKLLRKLDNEKPKFQDLKDLTLGIGSSFDPLDGIKVIDNYDKKPKVEVDKKDLNLNKPGVYEIIYKATDRSGNKTEKSRKITVLRKDKEGHKIVYLTFDDGPSQNTAKVLDILKKNKIHGTFFVTGTNQRYNYLIKRAYDEGNTIALHSYTHNYSIYRSEKTYFEDLKNVSDMVEKLIGKKSYYIRFPGGSSNTVSRRYNRGIMSRLTKEVQNRGYKYYDWNSSSGDASANTVPTRQIINNATNYSLDHINILFHDSAAKTTTVEALQSIIDHYKKRGYVFKRITDVSYEPHHGVNN